MIDIDHVCCMAHMRAKFKYAAEIEHDPYALRFLEYIGRLYALEKRYEEEKLSAEQVKHFRNSPRNGWNNNRDEKPAEPDEIGKRSETWKPDGEGGQISRSFLEPDFPVQERR